MSPPEQGAGVRVARDPLVAAAIEIVTGDEPLIVTGLPRNPAFTLPSRRRIVLPADTPPPPRPKIYEPDPLPSPVRAARVTGGRVAALNPAELRDLDPDAPIALALEHPGRLDIRSLRAPAAQAARTGRSLVIVVGRRG